jgi:hypothetical protein
MGDCNTPLLCRARRSNGRRGVGSFRTVNNPRDKSTQKRRLFYYSIILFFSFLDSARVICYGCYHCFKIDSDGIRFITCTYNYVASIYAY